MNTVVAFIYLTAGKPDTKMRITESTFSLLNSP